MAEGRVRRFGDLNDAGELVMNCYFYPAGLTTLADLLARLQEEAPDVDPATVNLTLSSAQWQDAASAEELTRWEAWRSQRIKRTEKWERETYRRLKAKFEGA